MAENMNDKSSGESGVEGLERDENVQNPDDFMREDADNHQDESH